MFENSQQEQNSGSGKIVGGVIAVGVVVLAAAYFLWFNQPPNSSGTGGKPAAAAQGAASATADAMADLKVVKSNLRRDDQTQTMAMWDIQVENKSKSVAYKNLKYATKYYNAEGAVIYQNEATLTGTVEPADQFSFAGVNDGLYPVGTVRYTVELKGAEAAQ